MAAVAQANMHGVPELGIGTVRQLVIGGGNTPSVTVAFDTVLAAAKHLDQEDCAGARAG